MMWSPFKSSGRASDESEAALAAGQAQLARVRQLHIQASEVGSAAVASRNRNHYGAAVIAAMQGKD